MKRGSSFFIGFGGLVLGLLPHVNELSFSPCSPCVLRVLRGYFTTENTEVPRRARRCVLRSMKAPTARPDWRRGEGRVVGDTGATKGAQTLERPDHEPRCQRAQSRKSGGRKPAGESSPCLLCALCGKKPRRTQRKHGGSGDSDSFSESNFPSMGGSRKK